MDISGEKLLPAPRERVWAALNDAAVLQRCITGCQSLERVAENEFAAIVTSRVGPVSATFRGSVTLSELDPPKGYTLTGRGQGGAAGFARMSSRVELQDEGEGTRLRYSARAEIGGKLASVGSRLVQSVAQKNADDFFEAFARQLSGQPGPGAAAQAAGPAAAPATAQPVPALQPAGHGTVPAWVALLTAGLGLALGYCIALLTR